MCEKIYKYITRVIMYRMNLKSLHFREILKMNIDFKVDFLKDKF